jgi:hypothetical protein
MADTGQKPLYKIEIYDLVPALLHTITSGACLVNVTPRVTTGVGTFTIVLSAGQGADLTEFTNVVPFYDAYIWLDYDSLSTNPRMRGKITAVRPIKNNNGAFVEITGINYGEALLRLHETNYWVSTRADTIVKAVNDAAGYDGAYNHITADATAINYDAVDKPLIDILTDVSEVRDKDWYVAYCYTHNAKELWWFPRQTDTSPVTLKEEDNLLTFNLPEDSKPVRNDIIVRGARLKTEPSDKDSWTETTNLWSGTYDAASTNADSVLGTWSVQFDRAAANSIVAYKTIPDPPRPVSAKYPHEYRNLHFALKYVSAGGNPGTLSLRLRDDNANYFRTILYPEFHHMVIGGDWVHFIIPLDREHEGCGMNNEWEEVATMDWDSINSFWFMPAFTGVADVCVRIDELYFGEGRVEGTASNGASQTSYGHKDMVVVDEHLSSAAASDYATYLLAQLKDPVKQLNATIPANLALQVGDKVKVEIPSRNIDTHYDLIQVSHTLSENGLVSQCLLSDRKQMRQLSSFQDLGAFLANMEKRLEITMAGKLFK